MKKVISILMAAVLMISSSTVWAQDSSVETENQIKVVDLTEQISIDTVEEIRNSINASLVYEDGTVVPIDAIVTIEDVSNTNTRSTTSNLENSYKVTVEASISETGNSSNSRKVVSDSGYKNGNVEASATLQMIWTDVLGTNNILNQVSGTLTVKKGTVESGTVKYGEGYRSAILWTSRDVGAASSFEFNPNKTLLDPAASYEIEFEEAFFSLYLTVESSIFQ